MLNPLVAYGAGAALLVGVFAGWSVRDWKADSDQLELTEAAHKAELDAIRATNLSSEQLEQALATLRPQAIETRNTIREVYRDVEVPAECAVPAAGRSVLEAARQRANAAAAGEPIPAVQQTP